MWKLEGSFYLRIHSKQVMDYFILRGLWKEVSTQLTSHSKASCHSFLQ